ncbi:MAG: transcriptional regulator [Candidatus Omnitrophica bacterium CG11_big_fil_rev_8_21_14_0_20_64_10]|nr:MAG: transcriptional regulator [Candidatus Omnitrophica bacterium CG11_big_fil_rev_8_21_14_0_20_64_10]
MDLTELLKRNEGKTLEFKRDLPSADSILRTIVAFSNTAGGVLLVGVENRTRRVCGVVGDPLILEERLANFIADGIRPHLVPDLEILPWRRAYVVAVQVYPSPTRPHHVKALGSEAGVFVRIGSTNCRADRELIQELGRWARNESFDEQPMPELDSEAVDFRVASESFAPIKVLKRSDLRTLRLTVHHQGREVPTVGGVLLFGKKREKYFPDAWVQAGRFEGTDRGRILDAAEIKTPLVRAVEETITFVKRNIARETVIGEVRHVERWAFPLPAVREAVINAIVHADYSQRGAPIRVAIYADRLEVDNPGLLPFGLAIEEIQKGISRLRNRVMGRVFHALGLIEQWGSGIQRILAACQEAGLKDPQFEEIGTHFRVTLFRERRRAPLVANADRMILHALEQSKSKGLSTHELAVRIRRSSRGTRARLVSLVGRGLVVEVGTGPKDPQRRYFLAQR